LLFFMVVIEPVGHIYSLATDSSKWADGSEWVDHGFHGLHDVVVQPLIWDFSWCSHWIASFSVIWWMYRHYDWL
jgi:hypothetical protein